jgi:hypothetical protein
LRLLETKTAKLNELDKKFLVLCLPALLLRRGKNVPFPAHGIEVKSDLHFSEFLEKTLPKRPFQGDVTDHRSRASGLNSTSVGSMSSKRPRMGASEILMLLIPLLIWRSSASSISYVV